MRVKKIKYISIMREREKEERDSQEFVISFNLKPNIAELIRTRIIRTRIKNTAKKITTVFLFL